MMKQKILIFFSVLFPLGIMAQTIPTATISLDCSKNGKTSYMWVDLGLSVKWAICNVGATTPEEYGDYFAWGETSPKTTYNWGTYKYCNSGSASMLTKYHTKSNYSSDFRVDNKITLELVDDAAHVNWGSTWRMPTDAEKEELRNNCTWTWTTQNGVEGYQVTGNNGNSIFLPAAGYRSNSNLSSAGSYGYYWSSSLSTYNNSDANDLYFNSSLVYMNSIDGRCRGLSVRPVCP